MRPTTTGTKPAGLTATDREALERAIAMKRQMSEADRLQVAGMLKEKPWRETAEFCSYGCQCDRLQLKPWQWPPCEVDPDWAEYTDDDHHGRIAAARLLERMLALGISRWEPDPVAAIVEAERARKDVARAACQIGIARVHEDGKCFDLAQRVFPVATVCCVAAKHAAETALFAGIITADAGEHIGWNHGCPPEQDLRHNILPRAAGQCGESSL